MNNMIVAGFAVLVTGLLCPSAYGQATYAHLQPPILLKAADTVIGAKRLYPSPVFQDMNRDGVMDLVLGDLRGILTVSLGERTATGVTFGKEVNLKATDGHDLKFHNW